MTANLDLGRAMGSAPGVRFEPGARYPDPAIAVLDPSFLALRVFSASVEQLATGMRWAEGPVWFGDGRYLLVSDIPNDRILRWDETTGATSVFRQSSNHANGLARDRQGRLLTCEHLGRRITRTEYDGSLTVLADRFEGRRLNSPNDIVCARDGSIWFTDPPFGLHGWWEGEPAEPELPFQGVFRLDPHTGRLQAMLTDLAGPNGLAFSPDERTLYVVESRAASRTDGGGHHHIVAFDVVDGQDLARPRVFAVVEPGLADGFRLDVHGFLYTSTGDSVQVFHPDGSRLARIPLPEKVGNLTFGGPAGDELFICASSSLYRIRLGTRGLPGR